MIAPRRRLLAVLATLAALTSIFVIAPALSASAEDLVLVVGSASRAIPATGVGKVVFPITVTSDGEKVELSTVTVVDITYLSETRSTAGVAATIDIKSAALTLTLSDASQFAQAGDYGVVLLVTATTAESQLLTVTLTRRAATVSAGATVDVVQYV